MNHHKIPAALVLVVVGLFIVMQHPRSFARGLDRVLGPSTCIVTVLPNDGNTSQNARAPITRFRFARTVYLITPAEMAAAGYASGSSPTTIGWDYQAAPGVSGAAPLIIYLQNTADTTNTKSTTWSTAIAPMTVVHNATTTLPSTAGTFDINFVGGSPFTYTGGGLYVAFDWGQYTGTLSTTAMVWCNTGLTGGLLGQQSNAAAPTTLLVSNFRPETRLRGMVPSNDASANALYSYGELPLGLVPTQAITGAIGNKGSSTLTNLPVMLNVTGADTFSDSQNIASIASCTGEGSATFAGYTPAALGTDTVTISVPNDDNNANNSLSKPTAITQLSYSYKYPGSTATGGVGVDMMTAAFVGKFITTAANAVTDVKLEFPAPVTATTYRVAIYPESSPGSGAPSTSALYVDAADRTPVAGPVTITLPSPVAVNGTFFVGIQQTNTTNADLSFDDEAPIRPGSFFFATPNPPTAWFDFAPGNNFKLNIGVLLQTPGGTAPVPSAVGSRKVQGGNPFDVNLPLDGSGIECRSGGGVYQVVFTFPNAVTFTSASVTAGTGTVSNSSGSGTSVITVNLSGVTNAQRLTVTLMNVADAVNAGNVSIQFGVLIGDTNNNGAVNSSDATQTKARIGQTLSAANFRSDVNANGVINSTDATQVKSNIGSGLP